MNRVTPYRRLLPLAIAVVTLMMIIPTAFAVGSIIASVDHMRITVYYSAASSNYHIRPDVVAAGGGEQAVSTNYHLDDTIGEGNIGPSRAATYDLNAGYRQTLAAYLSLNCTGSVNMGSIVQTGDTSVNVCGSTGYCASNAAACTVVTDGDAGYGLHWTITSGTGALGGRTGTGHLNGFVAGRRILAYTPGAARTPETMTVSNDARWAARLSSTSTTATGSGISWGTDGTSDRWLNVGTGSSVMIAKRTTRTSVAGDTENIGFRTIIQGAVIVPTDTYKATVTITVLTN